MDDFEDRIRTALHTRVDTVRVPNTLTVQPPPQPLTTVEEPGQGLRIVAASAAAVVLVVLAVGAISRLQPTDGAASSATPDIGPGFTALPTVGGGAATDVPTSKVSLGWVVARRPTSTTIRVIVHAGGCDRFTRLVWVDHGDRIVGTAVGVRDEQHWCPADIHETRLVLFLAQPLGGRILAHAPVDAPWRSAAERAALLRSATAWRHSDGDQGPSPHHVQVRW